MSLCASSVYCLRRHNLSICVVDVWVQMASTYFLSWTYLENHRYVDNWVPGLFPYRKSYCFSVHGMFKEGECLKFWHESPQCCLLLPKLHPTTLAFPHLPSSLPFSLLSINVLPHYSALNPSWSNLGLCNCGGGVGNIDCMVWWSWPDSYFKILCW